MSCVLGRELVLLMLTAAAFSAPRTCFPPKTWTAWRSRLISPDSPVTRRHKNNLYACRCHLHFVARAIIRAQRPVRRTRTYRRREPPAWASGGGNRTAQFLVVPSRPAIWRRVEAAKAAAASHERRPADRAYERQFQLSRVGSTRQRARAALSFAGRSAFTRAPVTESGLSRNAPVPLLPADPA
jgi:hypothetical protein